MSLCYAYYPGQPGCASNAKVFSEGTHRTATPEQTMAALERVCPAIGITRIADITGLDSVGIPVALAFRPLSRTLSISMGKGITQLLAKISAGMESLELWHAEHYEAERIEAAAKDLRLPYRPEALPQLRTSAWTSDIRCDWVSGYLMSGGEHCLVPAECVELDSVVSTPRWDLPGLLRTSNGLAGGNSVAEAALHALLEIIERDALADYHHTGDAEAVAFPTGLPAVDELANRLARTDNQVLLIRLPSRCGVPTFQAKISSATFRMTCTGAGCHTSTGVAMSRALTEAAQNRLGLIAASRDDLDAHLYDWQADDDLAPSLRPFQIPAKPFQVPMELRPSDTSAPTLPGVGAPRQASVMEDLEGVVSKVERTTGFSPVLVDLTKPDIGVPVARVIAPGMRFDARAVFTTASAPASAERSVRT